MIWEWNLRFASALKYIKCKLRSWKEGAKIKSAPAGVPVESTSHGEPTVGRVRGWQLPDRGGGSSELLLGHRHCARPLHILHNAADAVSACSTGTQPPTLAVIAGGHLQTCIPPPAWSLGLFASLLLSFLWRHGIPLCSQEARNGGRGGCWAILK